MTIYLSNLQFYCYHGLFEEENKVGGNYIVDVEFEIDTPAEPIRNIEQTVNYVEAYDRVKKRMMQPTQLLETIVMELCDALLPLSQVIQTVSVSLKKFALPIEGFQGNTAVRYIKRR